jgi:hypothetical protein
MLDRLREEGLNPWLDQEGLRFGAQWDHVLDDTISREVDYFLVLQSRALTSRVETFVHHEVKLALERHVKRAGSFVYPVEIDEGIEPLDAIMRAKIQSRPITDWNSDIKTLASIIKRDYARLQKRR